MQRKLLPNPPLVAAYCRYIIPDDIPLGPVCDIWTLRRPDLSILMGRGLFQSVHSLSVCTTLLGYVGCYLAEVIVLSLSLSKSSTV